MMLEYGINKTALRALIDEQVSQVADEAYGDNGMSLYDSIVLTEKDVNMVESFIDTAAQSLSARLFDICKMRKEGTTNYLSFDVPDFDTTMEENVKSAITHYIVFYACIAIFQSRRAQAVPDYTARAQTALDLAITLLKSRKAPTKPW